MTFRINKVRNSKISNETHESRTDPDATIAGKAHQTKSLFYKVHEAIDRSSRVIVDAHVTTGAVHETTVFGERVQKIRKYLKKKLKEVVADRGYGSAENFLLLKEYGIRSYIPLWSSRAGAKANEPGFTFDRVRDRYICPEGKFLTPTPTPCGNIQTYRRTYRDCAGCPRFESCIRPSPREAFRGKKILRNVHQDLFERIRRREQTRHFQRIQNERMWKMEGVFAEGKNCHGLNRARYRGRSKVQIQMYMTATVQNLKRLAAAVCFDFSSNLRGFIFSSTKPRFFAQILICD